jgi:hypothetical protein
LPLLRIALRKTERRRGKPAARPVLLRSTFFEEI